jgi:hypothetical protein
MDRLSEHSVYDPMEQADIGGTNASNAGGYLAMQDYRRCQSYQELGTWDSGDDLDECRLQQASDSSGTGVKDLTSDASGGNYDTDNPIDADGDFVIIEAQSSDLDGNSATPFTHVRQYVAEAGNSGTDNIFGALQRYEYNYAKAELKGGASTGSKVYVDTGT